jgi:hypothetical protein
MLPGIQRDTLCGLDKEGLSVSTVRSEVTCLGCLDHPDFRTSGLGASRPQRRTLTFPGDP